MTDNDCTNDMNPDEGTLTEGMPPMENVPVDDVYEEKAFGAADETVPDENDMTDDISDDTDNYGDTEGSEEVSDNVSDSGASDSESVSAKKNHSVDLDGYRAYRRKNFLKKEDEISESHSSKSSDTKSEEKSSGNLAVYYIGLVVITLFDFFAMHLFTTKQAYNLSDKILEALGFDVLHFTNITYEQICIGLGYFVAFIAGGVVLLILLKILNKLFSHFYLSKIGSACPIISLGIFTVIFVIGFITSYFSKDALLVMSVYKWGAPAMAYLGGLIFYGASKLHVGIEY